MVKRAKSPDLPDDAKYLVVHQPYPLNANFELPGDYIAFALWIATVLGSPTPVWGIHHKPKARSTVILEVDKKLPRATLQALLGEHRWSEVLKEPRDEEKERVSKVYFCTYGTQRAAQKDGWKRIHVEPEWFVDQGWNLTGGPFKHPYPETHWCPPLPEDPTNKNIAKPLPYSIKPPPPPAPTLVPGSVEWVEAVQAGKPTAEENAGAWRGKGARGGHGKRGNRGRPATQRVPAPNAAAGPSNTAALSQNAWSRISATQSSPAAMTAQVPNAPPGLSRAPHSAPAVPPGLTKGFSAMGLSDSEDEEVGVSMPLDGDQSDEDPDGILTPFDTYTPTEAAAEAGGAPINLWAQIEKKVEVEEEPMCSVHGKLCKKGICAERKKIEREKKKAEEAAERAAKIAEAKEKKKKREKQKREDQKDGFNGSTRRFRSKRDE